MPQHEGRNSAPTELETPKVKVPSLINYHTLGMVGKKFHVLGGSGDRLFGDYWVRKDRKKPLQERMGELNPSSRRFLPRAQALLTDVCEEEKELKDLDVGSEDYERKKREMNMFFEKLKENIMEYGRNNFTEEDFDAMLLKAKKDSKAFDPNNPEDRELEYRVNKREDVKMLYRQLNRNVSFQEYLRDFEKAVKEGSAEAQQELVQKMLKHEQIGGDKEMLRAVLKKMNTSETKDLNDGAYKLITNLIGGGK